MHAPSRTSARPCACAPSRRRQLSPSGCAAVRIRPRPLCDPAQSLRHLSCLHRAARASRGRSGPQDVRVPLATSPAPPQRPARPALILPCPRRRPGPEEWDCKLRSPAALTSRGRPGPQTERVPLAASPAPPPRPSRPAPIRPCPTKRAGWENGIVPNTPSRARVARPPWNSGLVSPARILAYAAAAPVAPSSIWPCSRIAQNGTADILDPPQPRSPGSQPTRLRRPPLQNSSCRSHTPPEGTLRS